MGFFDFVKGAGEKLFGDDETPETAEAAETPKAAASSEKPSRPRRDDPARIEKKLARRVEKLELGVKDLRIQFRGETARVFGEAATQRDRESIVLTLGNTSIVERVDDQMTVAAPPEPPAVFHTVAKGDTLWAISKKHYGAGNRYEEIFEANKPMLESADLIYPGQVLRIPESKLAAQA